MDNLILRNFRVVIVVVGVFALWQLINSVSSSWIGYRINMSEVDYNDKVDLLIFNKTSELRYEQLATHSVLELHTFSENCRGNGSAQGVVSGFFSIVSSVVLIVGIFFILQDFPWWFLALIFSSILIHSIGKIRVARNAYAQEEEELPIDRKRYYFRHEIVSPKYAKEIRSFATQEFFAKKLMKTIADDFNIAKSFAYKDVKDTWWINIISIIERILIYGYNVILFYRRYWTPGQFTMHITALWQFRDGIDNICNQLISIGEQAIYLDGFAKFLRLNSTHTGTESLPDGNGVICFDNVSFKYPGQTDFALQNINATIHLGEKISVVGTNGAGKTTFIYLMMGLYAPTDGVITYNGLNIEEISFDNYSKLFAPTFQDFSILQMRIIDNLLFAPETNEKMVNDAMHFVDDIGLLDAINILPNGVESYISQLFSENGVQLSGGEEQKLAIARALCQKRPILILDEPTSALSPQSEYDIYMNFDKITKSKTVVYISHRLASCSLSQKIFVFDAGLLVDEGDHSTLMKSDGLYAHMYNSQIELFGLNN